MAVYDATDGNTQFVLFDDGILEMRVRACCQDQNGGMDFANRTVAMFLLIASSPSSKLCPDASGEDRESTDPEHQ